MRTEAPGLLPILRSRHQADLLTQLLLHPEQDYTIAELARRLSIPQSTVSVEVQRLTDAGTQLDLQACTGGSNQQWHLPS